jgi:hypothetical protein
MRHVCALALLFVSAVVCTAQTPTPTPQPTARPSTWWERALVVLGVSTTPRAQRGEGDEVTGNIVVVSLDDDFRPTSRSEVTTGGGFRSPVFLPGGQSLLALKGEMIVKVSVEERTVEDVRAVPGIKKLVGVSSQEPDQVLIVTDVDNDNCPGIALFSLSTGTLTPLDYGQTDPDRIRVNSLVGWDRDYEGGNVSLFEETQRVRENGVEMNRLNVFIKPKNKPKIQVSNCVNPKRCAQPTYHSAPRLVAYVREE